MPRDDQDQGRRCEGGRSQLEGRPLKVAIVAAPTVCAASLFATHDDFLFIARRGDMVRRLGAPLLQSDVRIVAGDLEPVTLAGGVEIKPQCGVEQAGAVDLVYVPALFAEIEWLAPGAKPPPFDPRLLAWLRARYRAGATIASLCTGSIVLAEAGLLDGLPAATYSFLAGKMQARYPRLLVDGRSPLIVTGEGGRIVMGGDGVYQGDLMLYLIQRFMGREAMHAYAQLTGKFWAGDARNMYARLVAKTDHADAVIHEMQSWIENNLAAPEPVRAMTARANMTERTFARRFKEATGMAPLAYVQSLRVQRARDLLEASRIPVAEIAARVGYADVSHFTRMFKREAGMPPGEYRKRFKLPPEAFAPVGPGAARPVSAMT